MLSRGGVAFLLVLACILGFGSGIVRAEANADADAAADGETLVLVHYMPWYASKPVSGRWGWHWTMDRFQPEKIRENGWREAASQDYPLIGLYDSNDPQALECQALLMKFAGVDGAIMDWYGVEPFRDFGLIHRNAQHLVTYLKKANLRFAVCYEDQAVKHQVTSGRLPKDNDVAQGKTDLLWLENHWFADKSYVKIGGRPILPVFGPQYFRKDQWSELRKALPSRPLLFGLPHLSREAGFDGAFGWPPVSGGRNIEPDVWRKYLKALDVRAAKGEPIIASVFPGFHDIYQEAGLHPSYGRIDHRDGKTFDETLASARKSKAPVIQIATWNDYGEGTVIEPAKTFGYRYLERLQKSKKSALFSPDDLRLPVMVYLRKKQYANNPAAMKDLEKASALLFSSKCREAREILTKYPANEE